MRRIAGIVSRFPVSPAALRLRKPGAGGEIPDPNMCSAPGRFI